VCSSLSSFFFIFSFLFFFAPNHVGPWRPPRHGLGKSPYYLPQLSRKSDFSPWTPKPDKIPPSTFKTIYLTSLARL
jgi:hypothetical protein